MEVGHGNFTCNLKSLDLFGILDAVRWSVFQREVAQHVTLAYCPGLCSSWWLDGRPDFQHRPPRPIIVATSRAQGNDIVSGHRQEGPARSCGSSVYSQVDRENQAGYSTTPTTHGRPRLA